MTRYFCINGDVYKIYVMFNLLTWVCFCSILKYNCYGRIVMRGEEKYKLDDKYMTDITVRNDSVAIVSGVEGFYSCNTGEIRLRKGDMSWSDFGKKIDDTPEELVIIHERQHEIDVENKGVGTQKVSLDEDYQRTYHMEVGALIAEKLEIRRQFMEAQTEEEKKKFFEKFASNDEARDYVEALRSGKFNPNSVKSSDFIKEMEFIKNSSMEYRCDPNDNFYHGAITNNAIAYLLQEGNNVRSNPEGFKNEVRKIYQIGGFDFTSVGKQDFYPMKNSGLGVADRLLEAGADANKVAKFMKESTEGFSVSNEAFAWAEKFDVSGLSQEQAETLLQTAIVAKESADNVAESICLGDTNKYEFKTFAGQGQTALYLDMKRDIWEKNGILSEAGDEEKFNRLMKEAKTVEIDCEGWLKKIESILIIANDPSKKEEFEEVKRRVKENQGKVINVDDYSTGIRVPLKGTSIEDVLGNMIKEEEENRKFWEEYYKEHPEKKENKERLSESYQRRVMDLESSILADELKRKIEEENKVENLYTPDTLKQYVAINEDLKGRIANPKFNRAELRKITNEKGESIEVAMIDGKKHGAEITRDKEGNILGFKLYSHGNEIDLKTKNVEIVERDEKGMSYTAVKLDGQLFGAEVITDANGKTKASFYEQNGAMMVGTDITKNYVEGEFYNKEQLREEIKQQKGELYYTPQLKSQEMRFDRRIQKNSSKKDETNYVERRDETKESKKSGFVPVWRNNFQIGR